MKFLFRLFLAIHVGLYRLSGGKLGGTMFGNRVLLLTTTGRKSGKLLTVPLGTFERSGGYLVIASNAGQPTHPGWYFNLKSNPHASVQVMEKVIPVTAEIINGEARAQAWQQVITAAPNYAGYEKRTSREIPLILLHPNQDIS